MKNAVRFILLLSVMMPSCVGVREILAELETTKSIPPEEDLDFSIQPLIEEELPWAGSAKIVKEEALEFPVRKEQPQVLSDDELIDPSGMTVQTRVVCPKEYGRVKAGTQFGTYLRDLPLKGDGAKVHYYDGTLKANDVYVAVVDMDVGKRDLQQCADAVMRLRAEYLYQSGQYDAIHFNFTNGFNAKYSKWRAGNRISVKGNKVSWYPKGPKTTQYRSFRQYMNMVFAYAGTLSLSRELKPVALPNLQIGDVFIKGGSPGHAVIVVDVAVNKYGEKIFLLAQSYMPAQEIQILKNNHSRGLGPWYKADFETLYTPEWTFKAGELMRF